MKKKTSYVISWGIAAAIGATIAMPLQAQEFGPIPLAEVDAAKASLGKRLFFDARLSGDAAISCSTCHDPAFGFATNLPLAKAYPGSDGFRNAPSLINTALKDAWFHDGRLGTNLNDVTRESITETYTMNMDMRLMQERVKQDPIYVEMFADAGYGEPSNGSIRKAIPEYLKTLTSRGSDFDNGTMSDAATRGFDLFKGKAGCADCHTGPIFSDGTPHNTGVPENPAIWSDPKRHLTFVSFAMFMGIDNYMNLRRDPGASIRTNKVDGSDLGKFMTASLRELTYTAPYMHNGMIATLEDVVSFYNAGGGDDPNQDERIKPLNLSGEEQGDLVAFLTALSGDALTSEEHVWPVKVNVNYAPIEDWLDKQN